MSRTAEMILSLGRQCSTTVLTSGTLPDGELSTMIASGDFKKGVVLLRGVRLATRLCATDGNGGTQSTARSPQVGADGAHLGGETVSHRRRLGEDFQCRRNGLSVDPRTRGPFTRRDHRSSLPVSDRRARGPQMPTCPRHWCADTPCVSVRAIPVEACERSVSFPASRPGLVYRTHRQLPAKRLLPACLPTIAASAECP